MKTLLRCASHRARQKLFALLTEKPQGYFSMKTHATGGFYEVPSEIVLKSPALPGHPSVTGISNAGINEEEQP